MKVSIPATALQFAQSPAAAEAALKAHNARRPQLMEDRVQTGAVTRGKVCRGRSLRPSTALYFHVLRSALWARFEAAARS